MTARVLLSFTLQRFFRRMESNSDNSFSVVNSRSDFRSMIRLAIPALAEEFLVLAVTWTDWWLTGHFFAEDGDATKMAMSMMGYVMWLIPSLFAAVGIGATALVARYVGSGNLQQAKKCANQAFIVGGCIAAVLLIAAITWGQQFLAAMQLRGEAAEYASEYFHIAIWSIPLIMFSIVGASCLRGAGDMVTGFLVKLVVVITNILISFSLVTGWGPMPHVGWQGLAIGTAIGHSLGGLIILGVLLRGRAGLKLERILLKPDFSIIKNILMVGLPGGFDVAVLLFSQLIFLAMINALGTAAAAAHGLAVQIEAACFLPGAAFQAAAATMAGQFLGAGMPERATKSGWWCLAGGGLIMGTMAIVLYFYGHYFAYFFTGNWDDPTVIKVAELLQIISLIMPFLAIVMILTGSLRGAGDTFWPLLFTIFGFFVLRIPLAAVFSFETLPWLQSAGLNQIAFGWGVSGAWYAMIIDIVVRSQFALARFIHGGWKKIKLDE